MRTQASTPKFGPWIDISGLSTVEQHDSVVKPATLSQPSDGSLQQCASRQTSAELVSVAMISPSVPVL